MAGPKVESRPATEMAYIEHSGPYGKVPWQEYIERLYGWAKEHKVMPGFYPFGIYLDDPQKTPPEKCRSEIGITFKGKGSASKGVLTRKLPAMKVATISHKGPGSEFKNTYAKLHEFCEKKGLVCTGPPMEMYTKKPEVSGEETILYAKILFPVEKK